MSDEKEMVYIKIRIHLTRIVCATEKYFIERIVIFVSFEVTLCFASKNVIYSDFGFVVF